jgi:hypothetical protein
MARKNRVTQPKSLETRLTALEEGLKGAIFADNKAKRAFENLVAHGYEADRLIIHLTLWARSPKVLFSNSARSELPSRDAKRALQRLSLRLRLIAHELVTQDNCKELLNPKFLRVNRMVQENGGSEMARCVELLPQTLSMYSRLLTRSLLIKNAFARDEKTLNGHRAEFTCIFFDSVKGTTQKDRIDSVVELFNLASRYFGLGEHFEKRALTAQLNRLRKRLQRPPLPTRSIGKAASQRPASGALVALGVPS